MAPQDDDIQQSLAPPGEGLPFVQAFLLRYALFPVYCLTTSWDKALGAFEDEGHKLLALAESLEQDQLQLRVLIKAPMGIEDSSRFWSAAMVLEHLIEVGSRIAVGVVELTHGSPVSVKADIADVKPQGGAGPQIVEDYRQFLTDYSRMMNDEVGDRSSKERLDHPWFGQLNAHQWACLGAIHQSIHRKQLERIIAGLDRSTDDTPV